MADYLMKRLYDLGVDTIFGVPGDFNFELLDAVENNGNLKWVGNTNELNAGYAADGYARVNGLGAFVVTYGVGELSAINAVAGAFAEDLPVVIIVGMPVLKLQNSKVFFHHSFNDGRYNMFKDMYEKVCISCEILDGNDTQNKIDKAIESAVVYKKPVYIAVPMDIAKLPIVPVETASEIIINKEPLKKRAKGAADKIKNAETPVILTDVLCLRYELKKEIEKFAETSGIPIAFLPNGKSAVDESHPNFIGLYNGKLSESALQKFVENSDCVITIGAVFTDINGSNSCLKNNEKVMDLLKFAQGSQMRDFLTFLSELVPYRGNLVPSFPYGLDIPPANRDDKISCKYIFPKLQEFFKEGDIILADAGMSLYGVLPARIPDNTLFLLQMFWLSIGWATAAALGASMACKDRRTILLTGDGAFQMTSSELSTMLRYNQNLIVILLNNRGYSIERILAENTDAPFNDIQNWNYTSLVKSYSGKAFHTVVQSVGEFDKALESARVEYDDRLCFIEVLTDRHDYPPLAKKLDDLMVNSFGRK
ncbi:MAG: thiamine pyrophosphate-binding protein [Eubacteriales bacterium]|nr:thiamine pyrophosphate-binding protein [Eubacteriales bacterium]